jgi:hypothetical protein
MASSPSSMSQAAGTPRQGCLGRFIIPPFSVIVIGVIFALVLSQLQVGEAQTAPLPQSSVEDQLTGIAPLFTPEVQAWENEILVWSEKYQLNPNLVATVMQIESCGYVEALSPSGAQGLFQVMPYHFKEGENPFDPDINARRGLKYLRMAKEAGGNNRMALAGYNGGINGAQQPREQWSDEMNRYVYWGIGIYKDAQKGLESSSRLNEWLQSGGAALCKKSRLNQ